MFDRSPREIDVITTSEVIVSDRELQYSGGGGGGLEKNTGRSHFIITIRIKFYIDSRISLL